MDSDLLKPLRGTAVREFKSAEERTRYVDKHFPERKLVAGFDSGFYRLPNGGLLTVYESVCAIRYPAPITRARIARR